jgi:hypothetical protein
MESGMPCHIDRWSLRTTGNRLPDTLPHFVSAIITLSIVMLRANERLHDLGLFQRLATHRLAALSLSIANFWTSCRQFITCPLSGS